MCGFCGLIEKPDRDADGRLARVTAMAEAIRHRGPDSHASWACPETGLAFGHRRLAIIDLSPEGYQPMFSASGRHILVYNGEIYNYRDIRADLEAAGCRFRGGSDTEVLLAAVEAWGLEAALSRFVGMFAFALYDRRDRRLFLARDRVGIKPLYYGWTPEGFLFGSELKALLAHGSLERRINREALALFTRLGYVPAPHTIFEGVHTLSPGCWLEIPVDHRRPADFSPVADAPTAVRPRAWWSAARVCEEGLRHPFAGSEQEATDQLEAILSDAVRCRMVADVPLGAFLSGGIDSSLVVALMQAASDRPVKTFSIGFEEADYNEAHHARAVAGHLGTDHTELIVTPREAWEVVPGLPDMYDEPFADSSQIPTYLVSRLTRRSVTVSLSGDGGDELFGGYNRYVLAPRLWKAVRRVPGVVRRAGRRALTGIPLSAWESVFRLTRPVLPPTLRGRNLGDTLYKAADILACGSSREVYRKLCSSIDRPGDFVRGAVEPAMAATAGGPALEGADFVRWMMGVDLIGYHPDDILVKVDRASMAVSLEARVPLVDHRVVAFAASLPLDLLIREGRGKWLLRRVLHRHVPARLVERPKTGFGVPIGHWLRGPLRDWAEDLLDPTRLGGGYLDPAPVLRLWEEHRTGRRDWKYALWNILMFEAWRRRWA